LSTHATKWAANAQDLPIRDPERLRLQQNVYAIHLSAAIAAQDFPVKSYFALKVDFFEALVGLVGEQGFGQKAAKVYINE